MNGKEHSYELSKPMQWKQFKAMPIDVQREYINKLVAEYSVGPTALAEMFGCTGYTCSKHIKGTLGVTLPEYSSSKQKKVFIDGFCTPKPDEKSTGKGGRVKPAANTAPSAPDTAPTAAPDDIPAPAPVIATMPDVAPVVAMPAPEPATMLLSKTTLEFSGKCSAQFIADKLSALFGNDTNVKISIAIEAVE